MPRSRERTPRYVEFAINERGQKRGAGNGGVVARRKRERGVQDYGAEAMAQ